MIDALPLGEIDRQHSPLDSPFGHIKDGIEHGSHTQGARSSTAFGGGDHLFDPLPFLVSQVAWIYFFVHLPILHNLRRLFRQALSSPDAVMTKEWMPLVRFLPMQPRSNSSISHPGCFAPSSAGFSSFCLSSPRSHSRTSFKKRTSQVPRRYQRTTPCAPFWHSSCSETQDTAMS